MTIEFSQNVDSIVNIRIRTIAMNNTKPSKLIKTTSPTKTRKSDIGAQNQHE
jgi:hypothetical protein